MFIVDTVYLTPRIFDQLSTFAGNLFSSAMDMYNKRHFTRLFRSHSALTIIVVSRNRQNCLIDKIVNFIF